MFIVSCPAVPPTFWKLTLEPLKLELLSAVVGITATAAPTDVGKPNKPIVVPEPVTGLFTAPPPGR